MQPSKRIQNVAQWESHCRKIRARAVDLIAGRLGVIETTRALSKLAFGADLRNDDELVIFIGIDSETDTLVVGEVRQLWAADALVREDAKVRHTEGLYRETVLGAAERISDRFAWALEARAKRKAGDT